ncbi:MAG TPA: hypothetical protein VHP36_03485 [Chitinispirillaceae bacterium]|nr:hypothetical protein [Chitinispirillaceae bacterium]
MKRSIIALILTWLFLACMSNTGTNSEITTGGTSDETVVRTGAVIYEQDGVTPARGATVKVFKTDAIDGRYISLQTTGADGRYFIKDLQPGIYNIWTEKDSLVAFQDSVCILENETDLRDDTLNCASSLTGLAALEPSDNQSLTVMVIGTDKSVKDIDSTGHFTIRGMAGGKYSLLLKSNLPDCISTKQVVNLQKCTNDTLQDTIWMFDDSKFTRLTALREIYTDTVHYVSDKDFLSQLQLRVVNYFGEWSDSSKQ